ncbi:GLPGLI family protein [Pedobacter sp. UYP24]
MPNRKAVSQSIFFIIILFGLNASAQIKGSLNYKLTIKDGFTNEPRIINYMTYFSGNRSLEVPLPKVTNTELIADGDNSLVKTIVISTKKTNFIYKNFLSKQFLIGDNVQRNYYLIKDTLSNFKWRVSNEKRKISNYNCVKATTIFRGRTYEAWYTDDIAISNGPWKFCGLPGLIVLVKDAAAVYTYELTGINLKENFPQSILNVPTAYAKDKEITHKDFIVALNKKIKQNEALSRASLKVDGSNSSDMIISLPPKMEKF